MIPVSGDLFLIMGYFRKPEIGTGSLPPSEGTELEVSKIGVVEPSVGQRGF